VVRTKFSLEKGDIIICGTDGLWDNMFVDEITKVVTKNLEGLGEISNTVESVSNIAKELALLALNHGRDPYYASPFAQRSNRNNTRGGKLDDTTVLVSYVNEQFI